MKLREQKVYQVPTKGQQRSRKEAAVVVPWGRGLVRCFLEARPGRPLGCRLPQAHRCFCVNQRKLPSSWGYSPGPGCGLVSRALGGFQSPATNALPYTPGKLGATVGGRGCGLRALKSRGDSPVPAGVCFLLHCAGGWNSK